MRRAPKPGTRHVNIAISIRRGWDFVAAAKSSEEWMHRAGACPLALVSVSPQTKDSRDICVGGHG